MTPTNLNRVAIQALDDAALTQLAYDLDLAPAHVLHAAGRPWMIWKDGPHTRYEVWEPATCKAQATDVFDSLRSRPTWMLENTWVGSRPEGYQGHAEVSTPLDQYRVFYGTAPESEARALLLCAVLAAWAELNRPAHPDGFGEAIECFDEDQDDEDEGDAQAT